MQLHDLDGTILDHLVLALNIATPHDTRYSDTASDFSVMWTRLRSCFHRPSPRGRSALSLERVSHLVCFLMILFLAV